MPFGAWQQGSEADYFKGLPLPGRVTDTACNHR
jgi:hypothetical protein